MDETLKKIPSIIGYIILVVSLLWYVGLGELINVNNAPEEEYDVCKTLTVNDYWIECEYSTFNWGHNESPTSYILSCRGYGILNCYIGYITNPFDYDMFVNTYEFNELFFNSTEYKIEEMINHIRHEFPEPLQNITIFVNEKQVNIDDTRTDEQYLY